MIGGFSMTVVWLGIAVILGIVEAMTMGLITIWFVAGALFAMAAAYLGLVLYLQILIFIIVSFVLMLLTRPLVKRYIQPRMVPTNADRFVGQPGVVVQRINMVDGTGQVKVSGQVWSASAANGADLSEGTPVRVHEIRGVKLVVTRVDQSMD